MGRVAVAVQNSPSKLKYDLVTPPLSLTAFECRIGCILILEDFSEKRVGWLGTRTVNREQLLAHASNLHCAHTGDLPGDHGLDSEP